MEKQRIKSEFKFSRGLLKTALVLLVIFPLQAQGFKVSQLQQLRIRASENQQLYAGSEIKLALEIPHLAPGSIEISAPAYQDNVSFKTLRKTEAHGESEGTRLELWYVFEKPGEYELNALEVRINGSRQKILFDKLLITTNPRDMQPVAVVIFSNGFKITSDSPAMQTEAFKAQAGKPLKFKIYIQYGMQLMQFRWDIPKDSLFTRTREYEITEVKYRDKKYSDELIPVSDFEWTPLVAERLYFPNFDFTITGYEGNRVHLRFPPFFIQVERGRQTAGKADSTAFDSAFDFSEEEKPSVQEQEISVEDCQLIAELRGLEQKSVLGEAAKRRAELEKSLGLPHRQKEFKTVILYSSIAFCLLLAFLLVILIKSRSLIPSAAILILLILTLSLSVYSIVRTRQKFGICTGCTVSSIPEEYASGIAEIRSGNRVRILERAGEWNFVEFEAIKGWTKALNIIEIK